jgi:predicted MFS family arabinose efflux permease
MTEKKSNKRYVMLLIMAFGSQIMYFLPYLRWTYYDPLQAALGLNHTQFGNLTSILGIMAMISYFPGGWLADRFSTRKLLAISFAATGLGGFYYTTYPSYTMCLWLHAYWGITMTLTFWAALIKATRDLAGPDEQGRFFGLLEGSRSLVSTVVNLAVLQIFTLIGGKVFGLRFVIFFYSFAGIIAGILIWLFLEDSAPVAEEKKGAVMEDIKTVITMPVVWLIGIVVFCNYVCFSTQTYATPYLTKIFGASVGLSGALAIFRTWGVGIIGSPVAGLIADKTGSVSRVLIYCFVILAVGMGIYGFIPENPALMYVVVIDMMAVAIAVFGMRGIYFAAVDEACIPARLTGAAVGFASLIGFAPETFIYSLAGYWLDKFPGIKGYQVLFGFTSMVMIVGFVCSFILLKAVRKQKQSTPGLATGVI